MDHQIPSVMDHAVQDLIDNYLLGHLDEAARAEVEQRAQTDAEFSRELALRRTLVRSIERYSEAAERQKIAALDRALAAQGFFEKEQRPALTFQLGGRFFQNTYAWAAAASIAVLLAAATWIFFGKKPNAPDPLAEKPPATPDSYRDTPDTGRANKIPDPNAPQLLPPDPARPRRQYGDRARYLALAREAYRAPDFSSLRATGKTAPTLISQASEQYETGHFEQAAQLLDTVTAASNFYWKAVEIRAHARYRLGQTERAAGQFRRLAQGGIQPFSEEAEWFLLLCLAENFLRHRGEFEALRDKILADSGHPYFDAAQALAEKMKGGE